MKIRGTDSTFFTIDWAASVDCERHFIYGYTLREKPAAT